MVPFKTVYCCCLSILIMLQNPVCAFTCGFNSNFTEELFDSEGSFRDITHPLIFSETSTAGFDVCQSNRLKTMCTFSWRAQLKEPVVKRWVSKNDSFCSMELLEVSNTISASEIKISQLISRSLTVIYLYLENNDKKTVDTLRLIRLQVLYPPKVTSLTVDGQEVSSNYPVNEGEEVNISCSIDKGNPPVTFSLLDKQGNRLAEGTEHLSHSLSVRCEEDWPIIRCEGSGSEHNRTVSLLVRCPPQFIDTIPHVVDRDTYQIWNFNIRAHKTTLDRCLLTTVESGEKILTERNCILNGNPPELVLTIFLYKADKPTTGHWTLTLRNDKGSSNATWA